MGSRSYGTHPAIMGRIILLSTVTTLTLQVNVVELSGTYFCSANFLPGEV